MTDAEFDNLARELKPVLRPELILFAEFRGEPVGFALSLPDFNQAFVITSYSIHYTKLYEKEPRSSYSTCSLYSPEGRGFWCPRNSTAFGSPWSS